MGVWEQTWSLIAALAFIIMFSPNLFPFSRQTEPMSKSLEPKLGLLWPA
jgi:hypothetical protein